MAPEEGWEHAAVFGFDPRGRGKCLKGSLSREDASSEVRFRKSFLQDTGPECRQDETSEEVGATVQSESDEVTRGR